MNAGGTPAGENQFGGSSQSPRSRHDYGKERRGRRRSVAIRKPRRRSSKPLVLEGVKLFRPKKFADARGLFFETFNARTYAEGGVACVFVQDNQSLSRKAGTIRGLHFQRPPAAQAKLVRVVRGAIFDVAVDLRRGSPSYGRWCSATLTGDGGEQIFVPAGFAHGFCTLEEDTEVAYKVDSFYSPSCDAGLRWDDPDLAITWPVRPVDAAISEKDAVLPFFKKFVSPFGT
jgi:dTDP-4-dehydrorhamnose 3,5-epimerase